MVAMSTLIAQWASTAYSICKDTYLYVKGQRQDIKDLEERISKLILLLISISSEKERIDRLLSHSPSMEQTKAYTVMKSEIKVINNKYIKFIGKYAKITNNRLSSTTELDAATASLVIGELGGLKSKMMTFDFLRLGRLSRDIAKLSIRASAALGGLEPEKMTVRKSEPNQEKMDDDGHVLPVFDTYVDEVLEYLFEEEGKKVGILGCQGSGKTTVLRKVYDRLLEQKSSMANGGNKRPYELDSIIWIDSPPEKETTADGSNKSIVDIEALQKEIMSQLHIDHEASKSTVMNANTISKFLRHKKYILLMDHVSGVVDLEKLGLKQGHQFRKVVLCSRERTVLREMGREVEIQGLKDEEAQLLFQIIHGKFPDDSLRGIANRIIECCTGIPWMIREIAMNLREKKDTESWYHVKRVLQSEIKSNGFIDLNEFDKVYKMMYEGLERNTKKCLLYGALFPHQYKIYTDYLIECWIAEGFIPARNSPQKVRLSRVMGQDILKGLTEKDLFRWYSDQKKYVVMPPHFRRVALELGYSDEEGCVIWVPSIDDPNPDQNTWATVTRMSLIGSRMMKLPQTPQCCKIHTLLMQSLKPQLERLDDSFFSRMGSLRVLDLRGAEILALPGTINVLVNLKSLNLYGCPRLVALPPQVAELENLEFLDISGTLIPTLPREISFMVNMRCLRASLVEDNFELIIPPGIISELRNLEELSIDAAFGFQGGIAVAERIAIELATLEHLNTLYFNFPNMSSLSTFVTQSKALKNKETSWSSHTFRSFKISVGSHQTRRSLEPDFSGILAERWLRYSTSEEFSSACQELLNQGSALEIIGHDGLESFTCSRFDLHPVKICVVESCKDLRNIIDGYITNEEESFVKVSLLENLEKLYLYDLESLQCIWDGPVPTNTLANLTAITINGCPKLTKILDPALALSLQSLEYLKVHNCCQISKIIEGSDVTSEIVEESSNSKSNLLRSLKKMEVSDLAELISVCESTSIRWNSLKTMIVMRCSKLRNLSLSLANARKLDSIQCEESWWNRLTPDETKHHLHQFCCFKDDSLGRGEASSSGRSDENYITSIGEDLQASKTTTEEDDIQINGNHQTFNNQLAPSASENQDLCNFNKGCFSRQTERRYVSVLYIKLSPKACAHTDIVKQFISSTKCSIMEFT